VKKEAANLTDCRPGQVFVAHN